MNRFTAGFLVFFPLCACACADGPPADVGASTAAVTAPSGNDQVLADALVHQVVDGKLLGSDPKSGGDYAVLNATLGGTPDGDIAAAVRTIQCTASADACVLGILSGSADPRPGAMSSHSQLHVSVKLGIATAATMTTTAS